jgi:esterase
MALKLSYLEYGSGPALIILHGLFGSGRNWNTVAKALATTYKVYTLDLRNHGSSPWAEAMSYYDLAEDVHGFIEERRLAPVAVLGHSMGGKTAMVLALEHGHLVDRLIAVDIAPVVYGSDLEHYLKAMQDVPKTMNSSIGCFRKRSLRSSPVPVTGSMRISRSGL